MEVVFGLITTASAEDRYIGAMLTYLRYGLAMLCFAASVACLAWWWRSWTRRDVMLVQNGLTAYTRVGVESYLGALRIVLLGRDNAPTISWGHNSQPIDDQSRQLLAAAIERHGRFQGSSVQVRFPLWYPALIFALAGVASIRLGRRFTLRSVIIATAAVAGLLGMAVTL